MNTTQPKTKTSSVNIAEIEIHLQSKLGTRVSGLCLNVQTDGLVLQGCTRTYYDKQLAQHTLLTLTKLPLKTNEIIVK